MRNILVAFIIFLIFNHVSGQVPKLSNVPLEKVYLHVDRPNYSSGDDIWFKAYLTEAFSNRLFDGSNILYVELVSPASAVLQRKAIRLENGVGQGDFKLPDSIPSGKYQIRAYTNWMRNFGEPFFFKTEIDINSLLGIVMDKKKKKEEPAGKPDIQFFPESGSLIEDVFSEVAFKAIDNQGKGLAAHGWIISSNGDTVVSFKTTHLGMGSFNFTARKGLTYIATGYYESGETFKLPIPAPLKNGFVLKVTDKGTENIVVTLKTNQETLTKLSGKTLTIVGVSREYPCVTLKVPLKAPLQNVMVKKSEFPGGIAKFTVYDTASVPQCERLFFIYPSGKLKLEVTPDHKGYQPRGKVTLNIAVRDTANNPVAANVSLAVVDNQLIKQRAHSSNIFSYFLLESELKGPVEHPWYYFDPGNKDRTKAMDLLLLTQGWRDFVWKLLPERLSYPYPIEKGINITGKLRRLLKDTPIPGASISIGLLGGTQPVLGTVTTDSTGRYYFGAGFFTGQRTLIISARNKNHKSQGWLSLDSILGVPPPIDFRSVLTPEILAVNKEADRRYNVMKQYRLSDTILLNEVVVKGRKKNNDETDDGNFRVYGHADYSIKVTDDMAGYSDVFQLIQGRVAGVMVMGSYPDVSISIRGGRGNPHFLLDGVSVDIDFIATLPVSAIDKIEVLKNAGNLAMFGSRGGNGVISVFTKKGASWNPKPIFHSVNARVHGLDEARVFYSPKYDSPIPEHQKPDLRTTIFWAPDVAVDSTGNATVTFFNSDVSTSVQVSAEGISGNGTPLFNKMLYDVKSRQ